MIKMRRIDVAYTDGHWLAQIDTDCLPLDGPTLIQLTKEVQGALPDEALLFVVDYTTIEYYFEAEAQMTDEMPEPKDFYDGAAWSGADIRDLKWLLENGTPIEDVARLLRRATNVLEVVAKARELGLEVRHDSAAAEAEFLEASENGGATVISSAQEF
jgi:hypothetical protein